MSRSRVALVVLFFAALLVPVNAAHATYSMICTGYAPCSSKGYSSFGYDTHKGTSYWNMYTGTNCTNYVAYRLVTTNGMPNKRPKPGVGNAEDWGRAMSSITDSKPVAGSVAWWGRTGHHVAYVEKVVSSTEIWVSESNWAGAFDWRKIVKSGSGWPDGFIHFSDLKITNKEAPEVRGDARVGEPLSAWGGSWSPKGNTYSYRWQVDGKSISGANAKTYTPTPDQVGKDIRVRVRATRDSYPDATATSDASTVDLGRIVATETPAFSGTPQVDEPLKATTRGRWTPTGNTYTQQWLADDQPIDGATGTSFTPGPAQAGRRITFAVTATRDGYAPQTATSEPSSAVALGTLSATEKPVVTGTPKVGTALTASTGTWTRSGLTYAYQWYAGSTAIDGANDATFTPGADQLHQTIRVRVTATRDGYERATSVSSATAIVARGTFTNRSVPTVTGNARVGSRLSADPGSWSPSGTYVFQWYAGSTKIAGATDPTYTLTSHERGQQVRVRVTATRDGFTSLSALSVRTSEVRAGRISFTTAPRIRGTLAKGKVVTLDPGTHSPASATLTYQWLRDGKAISGATGTTRRVSSGDRGRVLSVRVTAKESGYTTEVVTTPGRRAAS